MSGNNNFLFSDTSADEEMLLKAANDWLGIIKEAADENQSVMSGAIASPPMRKKNKTYIHRNRENAEARLVSIYLVID